MSTTEEDDYDKEKYREMLLEAAEAILEYFGFDGTIYGDSIPKRIESGGMSLERSVEKT